MARVDYIIIEKPLGVSDKKTRDYLCRTIMILRVHVSREAEESRVGL